MVKSSAVANDEPPRGFKGFPFLQLCHAEEFNGKTKKCSGNEMQHRLIWNWKLVSGFFVLIVKQREKQFFSFMLFYANMYE